MLTDVLNAADHAIREETARTLRQRIEAAPRTIARCAMQAMCRAQGRAPSTDADTIAEIAIEKILRGVRAEIFRDAHGAVDIGHLKSELDGLAAKVAAAEQAARTGDAAPMAEGADTGDAGGAL